MKFQEYGKIVREDVAGRFTTVLLFNPRDIEIMFRHEGKYPVRLGLESLVAYRAVREKYYRSAGLLAVQGKEWHDLRTKVQAQMLHMKSVQSYLNQMNQISNDMIARMVHLMDNTGEVPDFINELYKWSLESVAFVALDARLGCVDLEQAPNSQSQRLIVAVNDIFQGMNDLEFMPLALWRYFPTRTWKRFVNAQDVFTEISMEYLNKALERIKASAEEDREMTFLETMLLKKQMDFRDVITVVLDMLVAGIDTTSHSMAFILYHLAKNPDVQKRAYQEVKLVLPYTSKSLSVSELNQLHYVKACIKESMRMNPIALGTLRMLDHEVVLSGYRVPPGVLLVAQNMVACRLEENFPEPLKFKPERWLKDEAENKTHPFLFIPFGFGPRMCVGKRIAEQEILVLVTKILRRFTVEYHHEDIDCYTRLVNVPDKPLRYQFVEREH
ncbi:putative cytochrome P450 12a5, mitochondrial [Tachypleus tridentatus]|uniref:putative cytochrome P450 12a5, mitochondrial n=1 Tax=Tachypleus tridentatus TaxID=6853 RepID=UPI003FD1CABF